MSASSKGPDALRGHITIPMRQDDLDRLDRHAKGIGRTKTEHARELILDGMDGPEAKVAHVKRG